MRLLMSARRPLFWLAVLLLAGCASPDLVPQAPTATALVLPPGYLLVWADEFDRPGLPDPARWLHDTHRNQAGWYNNELQYYAGPRAENAVVRGGQLLITARREAMRGAPDWGGQAYTSARLITRGRGDWTGGFFEIRARLPCGQGTWPAIWMVGSGGRWPEDGELDILEHIGARPGRVFSTVHTAAGSGGNGQGAHRMLPTVCERFHDYQMLWTATDIRFGIDGVEHFRYANPGTGVRAWPFDAPQFLVLNIAIGGDLGGRVDDHIFPLTMAVEHVRVYQAPR